ncbi:hypothetical protein BDZ94DRAFT_897933 [Collybia nuda]|uniref:TPR-like protein n=1 Tax=Collybia nuda TaxID=64659 RepID=A0A9P5Y0R3_9AGAR|nr:hypothetical protein BDZ94DRAFT_897933 [Collybia nuda]
MSTSRIENRMALLDQHHRAGLSRIEGVVANLQRTGYDMQITPAVTGADAKTLTVSSQTIENLYLHQQVQIVADSFSRLATTTRVSQGEPNGPYKHPITPTIISYDNSLVYHRHTVSIALEILRVLEDGPSKLQLQICAWNMVNLAIRLHSLEMYGDAVVMGIWTVDLYRTLVTTDAPAFEPYLALALHNLSRYYVDVGDDYKAEVVLHESIKSLRNLARTRSQTNIRLLLSNSLMALWSIVSRNKGIEQSLKTAHESLAVLEAVQEDPTQGPLLINEQPHSMELSAVTHPALRNSPMVKKMSQMKIPPHPDDNTTMWLEFNMARASYGLSCSLYDLGQYSEALEMGKRSFEILSPLAHQYPGRFEATLAGCLAHLSQDFIGVHRSIEDILYFSGRAVQIYRQLDCTRPDKFTQPLIKTLWEHAILLAENGEDEAAKGVAEEAVGIVRRSETDQRLLAEALYYSSWILQHLSLIESAVNLGKEVVAIYRELATEPDTRKILADRMCNLSCKLHVAGQLDDAVVACQEAVDVYRSIVSSNRTKSEIAGLAVSLSHLTHIASIAQKPDLALEAGSESLELYREFVYDDDSLVQDFLITLRRTSFTTCYSDNPRAITQSALIISDYRTLKTYYPYLDTRWGLASAFGDRDFVLGKYRLFHEALLNSEQLAMTVRSISEDSVEAAITFVDGLYVHAGNLSNVGRVKEAITVCEEGISRARGIRNNLMDQDIDLPLADMLYQYSQCLRAAGRDTEAFAASEEMLAIYRRHSSNEDKICGLREHSINLLKARRYMEAIELGEEAVKRCRQLDSAATLADFILPYALESLSTCLAEIGDENQALATIEEAVKFYRMSISNGRVTSIWAYVEALYADALVNLARRSMMKEDWAIAETALFEAKNIYQSRAAVAPGCCADLAITLDLTALLLHAVGRNSEGMLVIQDSTERRLRLEALYPEVAVLIQTALEDLETRPSQLALRQKILIIE